MSRPWPPLQPNPRALFSLIPLNKQTAERIVNHRENRSLVSLVPGVVNTLYPGQVTRGLNIGFHIAQKSRYTLAMIGRTGDITVENSSISREHCSFEIHPDTGEILLFDRSYARSTKTFGQNALSFELDRRHRQVVVSNKVNLQFGFGGVACDLFKFEIHWHDNPCNIQEQIENREDHPRYTRTLEDEIPTVEPSPRSTRIHTPVPRTAGSERGAHMIRYYTKGMLGSGSFGKVFKAVNVDTGDVFALKQVNYPEGGSQSQQRQAMKREVEIFGRLSHPNIAEFKHAQDEGTHLEIFTALREGNIEDLVKKGLFTRDPNLAKSLLHQMLQALDFLELKQVVHRDVKPANILYQSLEGGDYSFQLTDFGLCNYITVARTQAGTRMYMAPELFQDIRKEIQQTSKVDVWSLFVTLAYVLNVDGFRQKPFDTPALCIRAAQEAASDDNFSQVKEMAIIDPAARASAGDMLEKLFGGQGRSTRKGRAPAAPQNHSYDNDVNMHY